MKVYKFAKPYQTGKSGLYNFWLIKTAFPMSTRQIASHYTR